MNVSAETAGRMWAEPYDELARDIATADPGSPHFETGRVILDARLSIDGIAASKRTARATVLLVVATMLLVIAAAVQTAGALAS